MLKIDLHTHCNEDPNDKFITHSAKELIDHASKLNFDVLSITCHNKVVYSKSLQEYSNQKNILLIPGAEKDIEKRHVLLYNFTQEELDNINTLSDLRNVKRNDQMVIAPHPFYLHLNPMCPRQISLFSKLENNIDLFDGIEFCHLYTKRLNMPNKKAEELAARYKLPLVAGSDLHNLRHMGSNFSFIDAKKDMNSIFEAVKNKKITIYSRPRDPIEMTHILTFFTTGSLKQKLINTIKTN